MNATEARQALRAIVQNDQLPDAKALKQASELLARSTRQARWEEEATDEALWAGLAASEKDFEEGHTSSNEEVMSRLSKRFPYAL